MKQRITQLTLVKEGEPIFSEEGFSVEIVDEAGGEFVTVRSQLEGYGTIAINPGDWEALRDAIDYMITGCQS